MRHGSATVVNDAGEVPVTISVSVAVERPAAPASSYLRCTADVPENVRAAALSGARFARHAVDLHCFGIEVSEVAGDLDDPLAEEGLPVAVTFAVWSAWGHRWSEAKARPMAGWSLRPADA
jgi:hypothetical protein